MDYDTLLAEARKLPQDAREALARELLGENLLDDMHPAARAELERRIAEYEANPDADEGYTIEETITHAREAVSRFCSRQQEEVKAKAS